MQDSIRITRDNELVYDDVLDEDTLELISTPPPDTLLYQGKCIIKEDRLQTLPTIKGEQQVVEELYNILIPKVTTDIRIEDRIHVDTCQNDPYLVGRELRVVDLAGSTYRVYRRLWAKDPSRGR